MKESLHTIERQCIWKEGFQSAFDVRRNGGEATDVSFQNGVGTFNGTSSYVLYNIPILMKGMEHIRTQE